jgi:glycerophosphoryl diester phosphodiesterase
VIVRSMQSPVRPALAQGFAAPRTDAPSGSIDVKPSGNVLIGAHRGFHDGNEPYENTIGAYRRAISLGADLLETDIRRTADGVMVLHHDALIGGTPIATTNFADLPMLPSGEPVSTLQQLVDLEATSGGKSRLLLETKEHGYEADIVKMLKAQLQPRQYDMFSFDADSVKALHELAPESHVGLLVSPLPDWRTGHWPVRGADIVKYAKAAGADFVALTQWISTSDRIQTIADAGLAVGIYTVEDPKRIQKFLADRRVGLIISDRPDVALDLRDHDVPAQPPLLR